MQQIDYDLKRQLAVKWTSCNTAEAILREIENKTPLEFQPIVSKSASKQCPATLFLDTPILG